MSISGLHTQATAHSSSHDSDDAGEEGWDGYPLDLETTLQKKLHVVSSEDRDQTEQMSDSETPCPVSSHTRSRTGSRQGAAVHRDNATDGREDDGDTGRTTTQGNSATVVNMSMGTRLSPVTLPFADLLPQLHDARCVGDC